MYIIIVSDTPFLLRGVRWADIIWETKNIILQSIDLLVHKPSNLLTCISLRKKGGVSVMQVLNSFVVDGNCVLV